MWGTLLGVIVGGAIAILANLIQVRYRDFRLRKAIAGSLAGEIEGLTGAVTRRNYLGWLDSLLAEQRAAQAAARRTGTGPQAGPIEIRVSTFGPRVTFNYFAVFDKICDQIGLLGEMAGEVALFYTLAKGIVEDMNLLREGAQFQSIDQVIEFHQELRDILAEQLERARSLVPRLRAIETEKFLYFSP